MTPGYPPEAGLSAILRPLGMVVGCLQEVLVRSQKRSGLKIFAAVLAGVVAIGAPVVLLNTWLRAQGDDEVSITAG